MTQFIAEFLGTAVLLLLGDGVVANVVLKDTKGHASGWPVITIAWGLSVFVAVYMVGPYSGAHINPAVTLGMAIEGSLPWALVPTYLAGQMLGAALGAWLTYLLYRPHFAITQDLDAKLAVFCTGPALRKPLDNFISEVIGTFMLVLGVFFITSPKIAGPNGDTGNLGSLNALPVGFLVLVIGMSLGGPTGYAINPARDLAPRIVHALLPMKEKRDSDWGYSWIPVLGPFVGAALAAGTYILLIG